MSLDKRSHFWLELSASVALSGAAGIMGRFVRVFEDIFASIQIEFSLAERIIFGLIPLYHFTFPFFAGVGLLLIVERLHWDGGVGTKVRERVAGFFSKHYGADGAERRWVWMLRGTLVGALLLLLLGAYVLFARVHVMTFPSAP